MERVHPVSSASDWSKKKKNDTVRLWSDTKSYSSDTVKLQSVPLFSQNESPLGTELIEVKDKAGNLQLQMRGSFVSTDKKGVNSPCGRKSLTKRKECIDTYILNLIFNF